MKDSYEIKKLYGGAGRGYGGGGRICPLSIGLKAITLAVNLSLDPASIFANNEFA